MTAKPTLNVVLYSEFGNKESPISSTVGIWVTNIFKDKYDVETEFTSTDRVPSNSAVKVVVLCADNHWEAIRGYVNRFGVNMTIYLIQHKDYSEFPAYRHTETLDNLCKGTWTFIYTSESGDKVFLPQDSNWSIITQNLMLQVNNFKAEEDEGIDPDTLLTYTVQANEDALRASDNMLLTTFIEYLTKELYSYKLSKVDVNPELFVGVELIGSQKLLVKTNITESNAPNRLLLLIPVETVTRTVYKYANLMRKQGIITVVITLKTVGRSWHSFGKDAAVAVDPGENLRVLRVQLRNQKLPLLSSKQLEYLSSRINNIEEFLASL